ncbi:hypothetical protein BGZ46_008266 [Entomortierella lignicola]|nr:hypothetical protein BGZ46_008266 [Entomortierella lignicola]
MTNYRLSPLDLSFVLENIGNQLSLKDILNCTLVSKNWYSHFAPYVWWHILEDCDKLLLHIYQKNRLVSIPATTITRTTIRRAAATTTTTNPNSPFKNTATNRAPTVPTDPSFHLETEFVKYISEFSQKIENSPYAGHLKRTRTHLNSKSFISFILLGWLSENVKVINYVFTTPPFYQDYLRYNNIPNTGTAKVPKNCVISDQYYNTHERTHRAIEIIEKSRHLRVLNMEDSFGNKFVYSWISLLPSTVVFSYTLPPPPQWPNLISVELKGCKLDKFFLNILIVNSPSLKRLTLSEITVTRLSDIYDFPDKSYTIGDDTSDESIFGIPIIQELYLYRVEGVTSRQQIHFASQLPKLTNFSFIDNDESTPQVSLTSGFKALRTLRLVQRKALFRGGYHQVMLYASRIEELKLSGITMDPSVCRSFEGNFRTLTDVHLDSCGGDPTSSVNNNILHRILRSCYHLKSLKSTNGEQLYCDPYLFEREPWICTEIETLVVAPNCTTRAGSYTIEEARTRYFQQICSLMNLRDLGFAGGVGRYGFVVEEGICMLVVHLDQLEILRLESDGLETNADLTVEHAKMISKALPNLRAIRGFYHMDRRDFVDYLKEHRPEISLSYV